MAEDGDYMVQSHVGDGFGGCMCAIAVEDACTHGEDVSAKSRSQRTEWNMYVSGIVGSGSVLLAAKLAMTCMDDHAVGDRAAVSTLHE